MIVTASVALLAATLCQPEDIKPFIDPNLLYQIARHESDLKVDAVHHNKDRSIDYGATQINSRNMSYLGTSPSELTDTRAITVRGVSVPRGLCAAMRSTARFLANLARYNTGKPSSQAGIRYATGVINEPLIGGSRNITHQRTQSTPAGEPSAVYARPARAGHELVFK